MFFLTTILLFGFASAQKVIQLTYCSIDEHHLRMDCKYAPSAESPEVFCKYTQGERLLDTTDPDEEQHAPFKHRAKARIFPGNNCRLLFKNLPNGKSNFTCNIKQAESGTTATKTSVVEKSKIRLLMDIVYHSCAHPVILNTNKNIWWLLGKKKKKFLFLNLHYFFLIAELLLPCSAWSVLLQSCSGLLLTLMTLPMLLEIHWL
uniref:Thy-1 cell surface antigen n=1 Tax=Lates calcarifer TaxID=8187 RepID=A0A4W6BUR2_LATCA